MNMPDDSIRFYSSKKNKFRATDGVTVWKRGKGGIWLYKVRYIKTRWLEEEYKPDIERLEILYKDWVHQITIGAVYA